MPTTRDLVEAQAHHRRRLVAAFVSGAPGGVEVEPSRPVRTIVGGLALAVLLVAGAGVTALLGDRPDDDWDDPGLVISEEQGAAYVVLDEPAGPDALPELRPVLNTTSARLLLGAEGHEPRIVPQEVIETRPLGEDVGIPGAPARLPALGDLVDTGWTACTGPGRGLSVEVSDAPGVDPVPEAVATLVSTAAGDELWLVATAPETADAPARAHRYALRGDDAGAHDAFLRGAGFVGGTSDAVAVPRAWLRLFPRGGDLTPDAFGLELLGQAAPDQPPGVRVGDYARSGGGGFLVDDEGSLQPLTPFALALWRSLEPSRERGPRERDLEGASAPSAYAGARWPPTTLTPLTGRACALLDAAPDRPPSVRLATSPVEATSVQPADPADRVVVDAGAGAHVIIDEAVPGAGDDGDRILIDQQGRAHELAGEDTPGLLGYGDHAVPLVPRSWIDLFAPGVELSREAALCPPLPDDAEPDCG